MVNLNLAGALHFVTGSFVNRWPVFTEALCCEAFLDQLKELNQKCPSKLITYVLMPDHFHLISNPEDGRIKEFCSQLKAIAAKTMVQTSERFEFRQVELGHQVWQESFKAFPLWSERLIWQKINYVHANSVKARLVKSAKDYYWSGFRSFHGMGDEPLAIDSEWWWPDDAEKFKKAVRELSEEERRSLKGIDAT